MSSQRVVRIPEVELTLDQLVRAIQQLDPAARSEIAKALAKTELDARMTALIQSPDRMEPAEDITSAAITAEVEAVCREHIDEKTALGPIRAESPIDALYGLYRGHDLLGDLEAQRASQPVAEEG